MDRTEQLQVALVEQFLSAVQTGNANLVAGLLMENSTRISDAGDGKRPACDQ